MTKEQRFEKKFYDALNDIFVGVKVEGESGYINLMRIKSIYYEEGVFPKLNEDIKKALEPFPEFREELFEKLYTFFESYFSESGSIYFRYTPIHKNIYEKVYTDDKDVMLFWKTHMLYYVKTERLFKNLDVNIDEYKFFFDVSTLEHKRANEKKELIYEFKEKRKDEVIAFKVSYSERGTKTKVEDILRSLKKFGTEINEEILEKAFSVFEKQSEVDYFINKNAREFLKEQFNIWLYQYVFIGESEWTEERIKQLQVLKDIAFKIIDFISQFEDELVKIWNKPKFVINSNYVLSLKTLKKLVNEKDYNHIKQETFKNISTNSEYKKDIIETIREIYKQPLQKVYVSKVFISGDLFKLEYIKVFDNEEARKTYLEKNKKEKVFNEYLFDRKEKIKGFFATYSSNSLAKEINLENIYIDTKYFPDDFKSSLLDCISKKNSLDEILNGYLIRSDGYHVLQTVNKFKNRVRLVYIDPPFNTEGSSYAFIDKFKDSTWLSMMKDRIQFAKEFLTKNGSFYIHLDHNCNFIGRSLMDPIFNKEPDKEIIWNTGEALSGFKTQAMNWIRQHDTILYYSKEKPLFNKMWVKNSNESISGLGWLDVFKDEKAELFVYKYKDGHDKLGKFKLPKFDTKTIGDMWNDILSMMYTQNMTRENWGEDNTQKTENLLRRIIQSATDEGDVVFDYFVGSGTTIAAAHKLNRKWIGVEMGEYVETIVLKRMKTILFGDIRPKLSEDLNWQGGGFFKYYELEQYEDTLRRVKYEDSDLFENPYSNPYNQYIFMKDLKMLSALEIDNEKNKVKVDLSKLYENIDIAETLSNLLGKWIKRITADYVEFEDGDKIDLKNLDYKLIKPLIWW
jgi:adenine specific DNA methylase Mod